MPPITNQKVENTQHVDVIDTEQQNTTPILDGLHDVEKSVVLDQSAEEKQTLKNDVEREPGQSYTFLSLLEKNKTVYNKMKSMIEASGSTIEARSASIEHVWGELAMGALDTKMKELIGTNPKLLQTFKTGTSLYLTEWMNSLTEDQLGQVVSGVGSHSLVDSALGLFKTFQGFKDFQSQIASINSVVDMINIHSDHLLQTGDRHITTLPAFASPASFVALLKKHTPIAAQSPVSAHDLSFEQAFGMDQVLIVDPDVVIAGLEKSYTPTAHKLMEQVHKYGPQILEKRGALSDTIEGLYSYVGQLLPMFTDKPLSEMIEGTWIGSIANFVCKLLGVPSLKHYEDNMMLKDFNKTIPSQHREAIAQTLGYISTNSTDARYERYNELEKLISVSVEDKGKLMPLLPNQALMIESVKESMKQDQQPLFINPGVLQAAGINSQEYYIQDKDKKTIINPDKLSEYKKIISKKVEKICTLQRKQLLNPSTLKALLESGKTKDDLTIYLMTGLSYPTQAQQAAQYGLIRPIDMVSTTTVAVPPAPVEDETQDEEKTNNEKIETSQGTVTKEMTHYRDLVEVVIDKLEGGYYNPSMNIAKMGESGETMMGIDRRHGGILNTSTSGKEFWSLIDQDRKAHPDLRKHNYKGGALEPQLRQLAGDIIKPHFENLFAKYCSPQAQEIIKNDGRLLFHFIYGARNGSGRFQKFGKEIDKKINEGVTDSEMLLETISDYRINNSNSLIAQSGNKIEQIIA